MGGPPYIAWVRGRLPDRGGDTNVNDGTHTRGDGHAAMDCYAADVADRRDLSARKTGKAMLSTHRRGPRPPPVECGDLPFLIKRDGTWMYRGSPIGRKELVCLFASVLKRADDGSFWLETPAERGRIEVEDAPFLAVEMDWVGCGRDQALTFRTNVDELVTAGPEHPIRIAHDILTCEPTPYIRVRGTPEWPVEARIARAVYYELTALAEPSMKHCQRVMGVWSRGMFFSLGELPHGED
jgi:uncharacterized protein